MANQVLLLATIDTKQTEAEYLTRALAGLRIETHVMDLSLGSNGEVWSGGEKLAAMDRVIEEAGPKARAILDDHTKVVVGLGGGTGGEIILRVMRDLPAPLPKMLITPLPFDPRPMVADTSIILLPSLVDICGLNAGLRQVLDNGAAMIAGFCARTAAATSLAGAPSIGITALGATGQAADRIVQLLEAEGQEATVFHANGFGGAAFARFAASGAFKAVIDLTCHELTRMEFTGPHVPMPTRFTAASDAGLAQIVLPGGLNFLGFAEIESVPRHYLKRPHYQHSGLFTHVKLTANEMVQIAKVLARHLNAARGQVHLIVPMGGFSHQDAPGGAIEDPELRTVFLDTITAALAPKVRVTRLENHIGHPETARCVIDSLHSIL